MAGHSVIAGNLWDGDQAIGRTAWMIDAQPLIVFHKRHRFETMLSEPWLKYLHPYLGKQIWELEPSEWVWSRADQARFNCHTLAIGSQVGLTPEDWLEGSRSRWTADLNPAQLLLDHFFEPLDCGRSHLSESAEPWEISANGGQGSRAPVENIASQAEGWCDDDVLVWQDPGSGNLIHSGFVRWLDGHLIVVSKWGEGPILLTSLDVLTRFYHGHRQIMLAYRRRPSPQLLELAQLCN